MSKMTVAWLLIYFGAALSSFANPIYGIFGYMFEYYLRPSLHWWGLPLPDLRWNMTISIVLIASYFLTRDNLPQMRPVKNPALPWLIGFTLVMIVVTPSAAASWDRSYDAMVVFMKIVTIYVLITQIVRTTKGFDAVVAMHIAGAAWWGWEAYLNPKRSQSRLMMVGSSDTLDDNQASAHLLTVLPFIFVYMCTAKDKRLRALALVAAPLVVNVLILCNSRGAMVGLAVGTVAAFCLAKRGHRLRLIGAVVLGAVLFLGLADPEFIERQKTTSDYENQATATQRIESWRGGWNLIKDHPLGAGGKGYEVLSPIYIPEIVAAHGGEFRAAHNTYVQITSEWGFEGMFLYIGFVATTFLMLSRVRKRNLSDAMTYRVVGLQVGLIATMTASIFVNRLYGESFYWLCGLSTALYRIPDELVQEATEPVAQASSGLGGFLAARPRLPDAAGVHAR